MTIPENFTQATIHIEGPGAPKGAAVVFGTLHNIELSAAEHATAIHDAFADAFCASLTTAVTVAGCTVKFGPDETGATGESTGIPRQGTDGANPATPQVAYLLTKQTAVGGRRGRGRMFLPGVAEAYVDAGGIVLPAQVTELNDAGAAFLDALDTLGMAMVLLHDPATHWVLRNGQPRRVDNAEAPPEPDNVTALSCSTTCSTQRRRVR